MTDNACVLLVSLDQLLSLEQAKNVWLFCARGLAWPDVFSKLDFFNCIGGERWLSLDPCNGLVISTENPIAEPLRLRERI